MSWLARSIANSLNLTDPHPADDDAAASFNPNSIPESPRGVKEDLSDLKNTLSRQLWGVAAFLAPPPPSLPDDGSAVRGDDEEGGGEGDAVVFEGIRSDFAEIEGRLRSGISRISSNKAVWKFTKMASSLFQVGEGKEEGEGVVGVSEEAVVFARNVAMHPETWLDFPIVDGDEDDDFELSDAQYEHAVAIEKQAPGLAALRMELCPGYMTEGNFWKIYFVLLHPRLKKEDAVLLSTPQIMELRAMLMQELQSRNSGKQKSDLSERGAVLESGKSSHQELLSAPLSSGQVSEINESSISGTANSNFGPVAETEKHPVQASGIHVSRKPVDGEKQIDVDQVKYQRLYPNPSSQVVEDKYEDDGDDWLKEDTSDIAKVKGTTTINIENDEDVSFSDLEDDDGDIPATYKVTYGSDYLTRDSQDWVQLGGIPDDSAKAVNVGGGKGAKTEQATNNNVDTKDSNDWLDFDEVDEV